MSDQSDGLWFDWRPPRSTILGAIIFGLFALGYVVGRYL